MTGPGCTATTSAETLKSANLASSKRDISSKSLSVKPPWASGSAASSRENAGSAPSPASANISACAFLLGFATGAGAESGLATSVWGTDAGLLMVWVFLLAAARGDTLGFLAFSWAFAAFICALCSFLFVYLVRKVANF